MPKIPTFLFLVLGGIPAISSAVCDRECDTTFQCYERELCQFRDKAKADITASLQKLTAKYQAELATTSQVLMEEYQARLQAFVEQQRQEMTQALELSQTARDSLEKSQADIAVTLEKLTAQYQVELKATTQALMDEYQARLEAFETAYTQKMTGEAELARLAREAAEKDAKKTKELLKEAGANANKIKTLLEEASVDAKKTKALLEKSELSAEKPLQKPISQQKAETDEIQKRQQKSGVQQSSVSSSNRYTDNNDGTVTDNRSGLIWLKKANCFGKKNWHEATELAAKLTQGQCGLRDGSWAGMWRLPTKEEWEAMIDNKYLMLRILILIMVIEIL